MTRPRAFAAIINNNNILMTKHVYPDGEFWTLPGGGLEAGESFEEAVVREVKEEVSLDVEVVDYLFTGQYSGGEERCFLARQLNDQEPMLGCDPEYGENQTLNEVRWHSLESMKDDLHVSRVLEALKIVV
ncbi:NUDIX domain-containing protein [Bacillus sp. ISL-35]|uniref:NUDIX domain-containing protein n=1 Tax=Bacillus sp. ISL-35 TaxID=2819122 RepID=UPI001BED1053|nr:NUDIX domain-containing protein [Bacillus sp. ISL-35]MBT2680195.1 NUDIX domain-containing protein [Bacillus sp. ISL-35]MBT2704469.1 NUDIX domain-containing protein [Chryseobacterium sp. ISL-80]